MVVSIRLKELTGNLAKEEEMILKDYFGLRFPLILDMLEKMNFDFLLETANISRLLFEELHNKKISSRGERLLSKINILERHLNSLIEKFNNLDGILSGEREEFLEIFENTEFFESFNRKFNHLREKIIERKDITNLI